MRFPFLLSGVLMRTASAASPYVMTWSSQAYGPDGPWQAVELEVGSNAQTVDLYPGANWATTILMDSICTNKTLSSTCYAAEAGTFNQAESTSAVVLNRSSWETFYWSVQGGCTESVISDQVNLGGAVPNVSFQGIYQTYQTYPNGKAYPVSVGNLALGAPYLKNVVSGLTLNMIASWLYTDGDDNKIPSYSYGMHIGSVDPAIPGSLILGGYDKSRALGEVSAQSVSLESSSSGVFRIVLRDIGIAVATGGSPFNFTSRDGLFMQSSGNVLPKSVTIDPTKPYMYLPEATCDAITSSFPVSFDSGLGLYVWDTNSSTYADITSSTTYLSFSFNKNGLNNQNFTVNVPLTLLTLTLQDPLVDKNVTYFPCFYSTDAPVLGRAFLQAAFVGVNWFEGNNTGTWFLAQAPGPGTAAADITSINVNDTTLTPSEASWEQSWDGHWKSLAQSDSTNSTNPTNSTSSSGGLSTGAKAGIGVGAGVGGLILIAAIVWIVILRRRRNGSADAPEEEPKRPIRGFAELAARNNDSTAKELETKQPPRELDTKDTLQPQEMATGETRRYELA